MIKVTYDKLRKIGHCEIITDMPIDESKIYAGKRNVVGFAVDVGGDEGRNFGHDAYFKAYKVDDKMKVTADNYCSRIYYTRAEYFTHKRERTPTKLWVFTSKDRKNIYEILKSSITNHITNILDPTYLPPDSIINSITTYQYLIFIFNVLANNFQLSKWHIFNSSGLSVSNKFIPIDYPMPDYRNMVLRK